MLAAAGRAPKTRDVSGIAPEKKNLVQCKAATEWLGSGKGWKWQIKGEGVCEASPSTASNPFAHGMLWAWDGKQPHHGW